MIEDLVQYLRKEAKGYRETLIKTVNAELFERWAAEVEALQVKLAEALEGRKSKNWMHPQMAKQLNEQLSAVQAKLDSAHRLLRTISQWDHMDTASDGRYWRSEIDKELSGQPGPNTSASEAVFHDGCNYSAFLGSVCNKCGQLVRSGLSVAEKLEQLIKPAQTEKECGQPGCVHAAKEPDEKV